MAKNNSTTGSPLLAVIAWITGVIVSLAVGFAMIGTGALNQGIPWLSGIGDGIIVTIAGWIVVIATILSVILAILKK